MHRRHGCQCPWKLGQALALALWFAVLAGCYALFIPNISDTAAQAVVIVLFTAAALAVTCTYIIVCIVDPSTGVSSTPSADKPLLCDHCQGYVPDGSKHCKECHKCVENFDHHCKWVNNCIGSKNYRAFFVLLVATCSMLAVQLGSGVYLISRCFLDADMQSAKLAAVYPAYMSLKAYTAALSIYVLIVAAALYPLADLLLLHVVLSLRGITTYDYIMANRDAAVEPSALSRSFSWAISKVKSFGPRSSRVRDSSGLPTSSGSRSSSPGPTNNNTKRSKVGFNPCLACTTDIEIVRNRQEAYSSYHQGKDGAQGAKGFDAALIYTPRIDVDAQGMAGTHSGSGVQVVVGGQRGNPSNSSAGQQSAPVSAPTTAATAVTGITVAARSLNQESDQHSSAEAAMSPHGRQAVRFAVLTPQQ